ncbi:MAG TPA: hypothetical protein VEQ17_05065 [Steroidobacteraceae bacterium]|nr:hypothetical protein [Steroidobacteraceae bacterium]
MASPPFNAVSAQHNCNWPGCTKRVSIKLWGCMPHWSQLPQELRDRIYRCWNGGKGQNTDRYRAVLHESQHVARALQEKAGP